jgi:hypothetical protein
MTSLLGDDNFQKDYTNNVEFINVVQKTNLILEINNTSSRRIDTNAYFYNDGYADYKQLIQKNNCNTLFELNTFIKESELIYDKREPHLLFTSFISYGDLLKNITFDYKSSQKYLGKLDLTHITSSDDWNSYYEKIIMDAFKGNYTPEIDMDEFMLLPSYPKKYYSNVWDNWSKYLSLYLKENELIHKPINDPLFISKVEDNFNRISLYYSYNIEPIYISQIVKYVKNYCGLNDSIDLVGIAKTLRSSQNYIIELYFENKRLFIIDNKNGVNYIPENFTGTTFTLTNIQLNKKRHFIMEGIDVNNILQNMRSSTSVLSKYEVLIKKMDDIINN